MNGNGNTKTIVLGVCVVFVVTIASVTACAIAIEDGARASSVIGLVLGQLTSVIGVFVLLAKVSGLDTKVDQVATDTRDLTNGLLDAKSRAAIADVMHPDLINPEAHEQLEQDRAVRDARDPDNGH